MIVIEIDRVERMETRVSGNGSAANSDWGANLTSSRVFQVFSAKRDVLIGFANSLTRDQAIAEEAVHDALLYALTGVEKFDNELHAFRFLKWKTKMLVYDKARKALRSGHLGTDSITDIVSREIDPAESLERVEEEAIVRATLMKLSERQRSVLVAKYFLHLTGEQAANQLDIGTEAHKQLLHRAKASFRTNLASILKERDISLSDFLSGLSRHGTKLAAFSVALLLAFSSFAAIGNQEQSQVLNATSLMNETSEAGLVEKQPFGMKTSDPGLLQSVVDTSKEPIPTTELPHDSSRAQEISAGPTFYLAPSVESALLEPKEGLDLSEQDILVSFLQSAIGGIDSSLLNFSVLGTQSIPADGQIAFLSDEGCEVFIGLGTDSDQPVQYLSLMLRIDGYFFGLTPNTLVSTKSVTSAGQTRIEIGATDFLVGDFRGNFDFVTSGQNKLSNSYFFASITLDEAGVTSFTSDFFERESP